MGTSSNKGDEMRIFEVRNLLISKIKHCISKLIVPRSSFLPSSRAPLLAMRFQYSSDATWPLVSRRAGRSFRPAVTVSPRVHQMHHETFRASWMS